jgi:hypothetical protein
VLGWLNIIIDDGDEDICDDDEMTGEAVDDDKDADDNTVEFEEGISGRSTRNAVSGDADANDAEDDGGRLSNKKADNNLAGSDEDDDDEAEDDDDDESTMNATNGETSL